MKCLKIRKSCLIFVVLTLFYACSSLSNKMLRINPSSKRSFSFLESQVTVKLLSQVSSQIQIMLNSQLGKKRRYTDDGRTCATGFVQNKQTYTDCTTTKTPDGEDSNKEWCYVNAKEKGSKSWDFCKPNMNYDSLRKTNQEMIGEIGVKIRQENNQLSRQNLSAQSSLGKFDQNKKATEVFQLKVSELSSKINTLSQRVQSLLGKQKDWEDLENKATAVGEFTTEKLPKLGNNKKAASLLLGLSCRASSYSDMTNDLEDIGNMISSQELEDPHSDIRSNSIGLDQQINSELTHKISNSRENPALQQKPINENMNCEGMIGYEDSTSSAKCGLEAKYYNNDTFSGVYQTETIKSLEVDFAGSSPHPEVNSKVFSASYSGFLQPPTDGNYQFLITFIDFIELKIDDQIVVTNFPPNFGSIDAGSVSDFDMTSQWLLSISNQSDSNSNNSQPKLIESGLVNLFYSNKFKFEVKISFSESRHSQSEFLRVAFNVKWKSDKIPISNIDCANLSRTNTIQSAKISNSSLIGTIPFTIRATKENDLAFKDSSLYIIKDLPESLLNTKSLKSNFLTTSTNVSFEVGTEIELFVARLCVTSNPLGEDFEFVGERLSLVEVEKSDVNPSTDIKESEIKAKSVSLMKIYKKSFEAGKVSVNLKLVKENSSGVTLLFFYKEQISGLGKTQMSCSGNEIWLSKPKTKSFAGCSASSSMQGFTCEDGLNGEMVDKATSMWSSLSEGKGAWMEIKFDNYYLLTRLEYRSKLSIEERNFELRLEFSNGYDQQVRLANDYEIQMIEIVPHQKTRSIKVIIDSTITVNNNGFALKIYGLRCKTTSGADDSVIGYFKKAFGEHIVDIKNIFDSKLEQVVYLDCKSSFSNNKKLNELVETGSIVVFCHSTCRYSSALVYGTDIYAKDSAICKSGYHAGVLKAGGGKFVVEVKNSQVRNLAGSIRNNVSSKSKSYSPISLSFKQTTSSLKSIDVAIGLKLDYLDPNTGEWLPTIVKDVKQPENGNIPNKTVYLSLAVESQQSTFAGSISYPNSSLKRCGKKIINRPCGSNTNGSISQIKIKFLPQGIPNNDPSMIIENGQIFGFKGNPFGFSEEVTEKLRRQAITSIQDSRNEYNLQGIFEFPYPRSSSLCLSQSPNIDCRSISYHIKTGNGKFLVKLHVGDTLSDSLVDFKINNVDVVSSKLVAKGDYQIFSKSIKVTDEFIQISTECVEDCENHKSKFNMIEIALEKDNDRYSESQMALQNELIPGASNNATKDECNHSFFGPKCNQGIDVLHCVFETLADKQSMMCSGDKYLIQIPSDYKCTALRKQYKCVLLSYISKDECEKFCPTSCSKTKCI